MDLPIIRVGFLSPMLLSHGQDVIFDYKCESNRLTPSRILSSARFDAQMSQWFYMWSVENPDERQEMQTEGLKESVSCMDDIIKNEVNIVPHDRIILDGISQDCATALYTLMAGGIRLGGYIGLCSWVAFEEDLRKLTADNYALYRLVFLSHPKDDDVVPVKNGLRLKENLSQFGMIGLTWKEYDDGGHRVKEPQGIDDMVKFLRKTHK